MRSFRVRRQGSQRGEEEDVWGIDAPLTPVLFDEGSHSPAALSLDERNGMRLGESVTNITTPKAEDRELSGGRLVNEEAVYNMRKRWISERLHERAADFCRYSTVTVFCGTYNVAGNKSDGASLGPWLAQCSNDADIYAIGFQEIVDLNAVNVAMSDSKTQQRASIWRHEIESFLSSRGSRYTLIEQRTLVGIVLFVYVRHGLVANGAVKDVQASTARVGVMGVMGNKGATAVRLNLYDSTLCFVCAHMAAKRANVAGRNADFWSILGKTAFAGDPETAWEFRDLPCEFSRGRQEGGIGVLDHDVVFWLGDLNYRVSERVQLEDVFRRCGTEDGREFLRAHDQLNLERSRGPRAAFGEFEEAPLTFAPTYKFQPGTQVYEERPEKKRRAPAWCDRVLWRAREAGHINCMRYSSADLVLSDHKPVCAELATKVRQIDRVQRVRLFEEITGYIRRVESQGAAPELKLGTGFLDLGDVFYRTVTSKVLRVANVGQGLAFVRFTPKLGETIPFRRWLQVEPAFALLLPGERAEFRVSVFVDRLTAREICGGFDVLEDTLILRLEGGAEHYIPVRGHYASTAFGTPVEKLVARHGLEGTRLGIPIELWRLVDAVIKRGALQAPEEAVNLFPAEEMLPSTDVPLDDQTTAVLRCLDTGSEFPASTSGQALVSAILVFLGALPEPVVPVAAVKAVESELAAHRASGRATGSGAGAIGHTWGEIFLRALSPVQHNVFLYMAGFLREVVKAGRPTGLRPGSVVSLVCDALSFADSPWLGCPRSIVGVGGEVITANGYSARDGSWKAHREVFRAILISFISSTK